MHEFYVGVELDGFGTLVVDTEFVLISGCICFGRFDRVSHVYCIEYVGCVGSVEDVEGSGYDGLYYIVVGVDIVHVGCCKRDEVVESGLSVCFSDSEFYGDIEFGGSCKRALDIGFVEVD